MHKEEPSKLLALIKLVITLAIVAGVVFAILQILAAVNQATDQAKAKLAGKGVNITKNGVAVKTDKRAATMEETQDKLQSGLMKGWKNASFNVPWILQKGTNLSGSSHDKSKEQWEKKHGPKHKKVS